MSRARKQHWLLRFATIFVVLAAILLVLTLSTAITVGASQAFSQITLALPVFFLFFVLVAPLGAWLEVDRFLFVPQPYVLVAPSRGPPA
jgi:hypothetical protein